MNSARPGNLDFDQGYRALTVLVILALVCDAQLRRIRVDMRI